MKDIIARVDYCDKLLDLLPPQKLKYPPHHIPGTKVKSRVVYDPFSDINIRRQIIYLQDRSQLLFLRLESKYGHDKVQDLSSNEIKDALSGSWEVCQEGLGYTMHEGMLPDLAPILQALSLWRKTCDKPFEYDPFVKSVLRIFVKSVFQPSKVREINCSLSNELKESRVGDKHSKKHRRQLIMLISKLLFCSLAGFYRHAEYVVSYETRKHLYRWLMFDVPTIKEMRSWFMYHKMLLTFVLREYHIFYIDNVGAHREVFDKLYEYPLIRNNVLHSMDRVRVQFDEGVQNTLKVLEQFYEQRDNVSEWKKKIFLSTFVIDCALLHNEGTCVYYFCQKYSQNGMGDLLKFMFWRFTYIGSFTQFGDTMSTDMESNIRSIILYWLLVKECCQQASLKQTKEDYIKCIDAIPTGKLVPPLPVKHEKNPLLKSCMNNAKGVQDDVIRNFKCCCDKTEHDLCLLNIIATLVQSFNVHYVTRPSSTDTAIDYRTTMDWFSIEKYLSEQYTDCLAWNYRPRLTTFADEMVDSMRKVRQYYKSARDKKLKQKCKWLTPDLVKPYWDTFEKYKANERDKICKMIRQVMDNTPPSQEVGVGWMGFGFGLCEQSVRAIGEARKLMLSETNRKEPYNACEFISKTSPRDFWILRDFFKIRHKHESIRVYPLPKDYAEQQVKTLHRKLNIVSVGQELPESASTVYYCPHHRTLRAGLVGTEFEKRGYDNTINIGPSKVAVDPMTKEKYCTIRTQRGDRRPTSMMMIEEKEPKKKKNQKCLFVPLRKVNLLGRILQLYHKLYLLCPWCACPMQYSMEKFCEIGLWCGCCLPGEEKMARKLGIPWNFYEQRADVRAVPNVMHGLKVLGHVCYWCKTVPRRNRHTTYLLMYDDIKSYKLVYVPWCDRDYRAWMSTGAGQMRLSVIVKSIQGRIVRDKHSFPYNCTKKEGTGHLQSFATRLYNTYV